MKSFKFLGVPIDLGISMPDGHEFVGITPIYYDPWTFDSYKFILTKDISTGEVTKLCKIYPNDPLWEHNL